MPLATIGFGFSRIVSHKMTYVIFLSKITSLQSLDSRWPLTRERIYLGVH